MKHLIIILISLFAFAVVMPSCSKSTCPTYATSKPTKQKKGHAAYDKGNAKKDKRTTKGKASTGLF